MAEAMDAYWRLPPVARTVASVVFATSALVYAGILPGSWFFFHTAYLFTAVPGLWRIPTSFLLTMPKLSVLLDPYFVYTHLALLETANPRFSRREDLIWYLGVVSVATISCQLTMQKIIDHLAGFHSGTYLQALILALAYTGTQDQRNGAKASVFFFTIPAQLLPYAMLLMSMVMNGPGYAMSQLCGLVAAHFYDFATRLWPEFGGGFNLAPTPAFLSRIVASTAGPRPGTTAAAHAAGRTTGANTGPLPSSWQTRGRGTRLGGD